MTRGLVFAALTALLLGLAGCEKVMRDMYDQPRHGPAGSSPLFEDRQSSRPPPEGSVPQARGTAAGTSSGRAGSAALATARAAELAQALPRPVPMDMLSRGRERYQIYCLPCHSPVGDGDGRVVRRGFPAPPSFHIDRLRDAPDRHFYDVISQGYGVMYPYGDRIEPADRWAIVAYLRALQLSQHAPADALPPGMKAALVGAPTPTPTTSTSTTSRAMPGSPASAPGGAP